jgi:cytoplasmic iron level regulating protein YaaA (DUF328/UPF0246 family)
MIFVLSPAKTLDFSPAPAGLPQTRPEMSGDVKKLAQTARKLKTADLRRLMDISEPLAELNVARFSAFQPGGTEHDVPAALAFAGDVYTGLAARDLATEDLLWAQGRVRILSGLYGLLRPLDRIQPYRLEMGVRLATERGSTLYDFWGDKLARGLNKAAAGHADPCLINLASQEYYGAVDARALKLDVIACVFKEDRAGETRIISFYAKRARGLMTRFAVQNRIEAREELKLFDLGGYRYNGALSSDAEWVFTRPQPDPKDAPHLSHEDAQL